MNELFLIKILLTIISFFLVTILGGVFKMYHTLTQVNTSVALIVVQHQTLDKTVEGNVSDIKEMREKMHDLRNELPEIVTKMVEQC